MRNNLYFFINLSVIIVSVVGLVVVTSSPANAQIDSLPVSTSLTSPEQVSAEVVSWLKTGMSVAFILTLLFGAHNMWLHNKFTGFKEQTVTIIREEFKPQMAKMADKQSMDNFIKLQEEIFKRMEYKFDEGLTRMEKKVDQFATRVEVSNDRNRNR